LLRRRGYKSWLDVGTNSHSISDHTQTIWNGIVGKIALQCRPQRFIADAQVYPDIQLDDFSPSMQPIVRVIDDWFKNQSLGLIFELKVCQGKLLVSGIDLVSDAVDRPAARQLLYSLKKYMTSDQFQPKTEAEVSAVKNLISG